MKLAAALCLLLAGVAFWPLWQDHLAIKWAVVFIGAAAAAVGLLRSRALRIDMVDIAALRFGVWASLSLTWTPDPVAGRWFAVILAGAILCFLGARRIAPGNEAWIEGALWLAVPATIIFEHFGVASGGFGNENFQAAFYLVALPWLCTRHSWPIAVLAVIATLIDSSKLEYPVAALIIAVWLWRKGGYWRPFTTMVTLACIGAVIEIRDTHISLFSRAETMFTTLLLWLEKPLTGQGIGSYVHEYGRLGHIYNDIMPEWFQIRGLGPVFITSGRAHSDALQIPMELGLIGMIPIGYVLWRALRARDGRSGVKCALQQNQKPQISRGGAPTAIAVHFAPHKRALVSLLAIFALALIDFPVQQPATAFVLIACLATMLPVEARWTLQNRPVCQAVATTALAMLVCWGSYQSYWAMVSAYHFDDFYKRWQTQPGRAFLANAKAVEAFPAHRRFRLQLVRSLAYAHRAERAIVDRRGVEHVYRVSASAAPYDDGVRQGRLTLLLDMKARGK